VGTGSRPPSTPLRIASKPLHGCSIPNNSRLVWCEIGSARPTFASERSATTHIPDKRVYPAIHRLTYAIQTELPILRGELNEKTRNQSIIHTPGPFK
jgi:hypothetical protein